MPSAARLCTRGSATNTATLAASSADTKTAVLAGLIRDYVRGSIRHLLVVGCGSGIEAMTLAAELRTEVIGIDPQSDGFDPVAAAAVDLRHGDAVDLEFPDRAFDFVFSYHALEHIPRYSEALAEMARVLRPGGAYCVGTPNRLRIAGYLGSKDATALEILQWNAADWHARLRGRFRNEFGAHAGFSAAELAHVLTRAFDDAEDITLAYYRRLYPRHARFLRLARGLRIDRLISPSIYFLGRKPRDTPLWAETGVLGGSGGPQRPATGPSTPNVAAR